MRNAHATAKNFLILVFCMFLLAGVAVRAGAQEPEVLSLEQLIELAVAYSPQLKQSEQQVAAARSDLMQARGGMFPQLELVGTTGPSENADLPTVIVNEEIAPGVFSGFIQNNDKDSVGIFGRLDLAIFQPLYTFGKISHRKNAAALGVEAQKHGQRVVTSEVILNVKELYYSMIVARQGEGAARNAGDFIQDARDRITRMIAAGSPNVDETDLYRLEAFEAEISRFRARAESGSRLAYQALKRAIGYPEGKEFQLDRRDLPTEGPSLGNVEDYMRMALDARPELKQLESGIEARKSMLKASQADLYPTFFVAAIGSLAGAPGRDRMPISYFGDRFNHSHMGVILGSEWKFDFGIKQGRLGRARAEFQELLHKKEFAEDNIPVQVLKYYEDTLEAEKSMKAYRNGLIAARRWVVASFSNFDFGLGTAKDMFDAIDRYGKNEGEYLSALLNYNVSRARLEHAAGLYDLKEASPSQPRSAR